MSDRIFGFFGLALAVFYLWATSIIPDSFMIDVDRPEGLSVHRRDRARNLFAVHTVATGCGAGMAEPGQTH